MVCTAAKRCKRHASNGTETDDDADDAVVSWQNFSLHQKTRRIRQSVMKTASKTVRDVLNHGIILCTYEMAPSLHYILQSSRRLTTQSDVITVWKAIHCNEMENVL